MSGLGAACEALTSPQPCCTVTLIKHKHGPDAYATAVPLNTTWELVFTPTFGKDWRRKEGQNLSLESLTAAQNGDKAALRDVRQICQGAGGQVLQVPGPGDSRASRWGEPNPSWGCLEYAQG